MATPPPYTPSYIKRFFAGLAGYDLRLLSQYAPNNIEHEEKN
jgi:hypothetical protein